VVADADRRDRQAFQLPVQRGLMHGVQGAGRFVQHRIARAGDQHPGEGQALLLSGGQQLGPVALGRQPAHPVREFRQRHPL